MEDLIRNLARLLVVVWLHRLQFRIFDRQEREQKSPGRLLVQAKFRLAARKMAGNFVQD